MSLSALIIPQPSGWVRFGRPLLLVAVILLGMAAASTKLVEMPQEVAFFAKAGIVPEALSLLGAVEFFSALLLIFPRTRLAAGLILASCFGVTAWLQWNLGQVWMAALATAPVVLTVFAIFWRAPRPQTNPFKS